MRHGDESRTKTELTGDLKERRLLLGVCFHERLHGGEKESTLVLVNILGRIEPDVQLKSERNLPEKGALVRIQSLLDAGDGVVCRRLGHCAVAVG